MTVITPFVPAVGLLKAVRHSMTLMDTVALSTGWDSTVTCYESSLSFLYDGRVSCNRKHLVCNGLTIDLTI